MGSGVSQTRSSRRSSPWPSDAPPPASCPSVAFVVGRDTRRSGPLLQAALSAGLATEGADVIDLGRAAHARAWPTWPSVGGSPGAMVSASHNPFGDNGIKLFSAAGHQVARRGRSRGRARARLDSRRPRSAPPPTHRARGGADHRRSRRRRPLPRPPAGGDRRRDASTACTSWSTAPTAPPASSPPRCWPGSAPPSPRCTTTRTASTSTTSADRPIPGSCPAR